MTITQRAIALSVQQVEALNSLISEMRPPLDPPGRPQCALFLTIAEQFDATVCLARANLLSHGAVHVRSMMEAAADLYMLGIADDHVRRMQYEQVSGEVRFYERMLESHSLPSFDREPVTSRLNLCRERRAPLHAEFKSNWLGEADKFAAAQMPEFTSMYTLLCGFVHNDLTALSLRHQSDGPGMTIRAGLRDDIAYVILQIAHHALVRTAQRIGEVAYFPDGHFEHHYGEMERLYEKFVEMRPRREPGSKA